MFCSKSNGYYCWHPWAPENVPLFPPLWAALDMTTSIWQKKKIETPSFSTHIHTHIHVQHHNDCGHCSSECIICPSTDQYFHKSLGQFPEWMRSIQPIRWNILMSDNRVDQLRSYLTNMSERRTDILHAV